MKICEIMKDIVYWQRLLRMGGYYTDSIDGIRGPLTVAAEERWQADASAIAEEVGRFDSRSEDAIATLLPVTQRVARRWLKQAVPLAQSAGLEVKIICGTRSYAEQNRLFAKTPRVTRARGGQSMHNFGLAFDFGLFRGRAYLEDSAQYVRLGRLCLQMPEETWGGSWKSLVDTPHIQLNLYAGTSAARTAFEQ